MKVIKIDTHWIKSTGYKNKPTRLSINVCLRNAKNDSKKKGL